MKPKFWLSVAFLISRIGLFQAAVQCETKENSIGGKFLRGHTFKTCNVELPECFIRCDEEVTCQSFNFVIGQNLCELNNRTKEARPEDFRPDQTRLYMKRANNRGTLTFPLLPCLFLFFQCNFFFIFNAAFRGERNFTSGEGFYYWSGRKGKMSAWLQPNGRCKPIC